MKSLAFIIATCWLWSAMGDLAFAQLPIPQNGDRVRLSVLDTKTFKYNHIRGDFIEISGEYMLISRGNSTIQYPLFTVGELEISNGVKRKTGSGALIGAALGGTFLGMYASVESSKSSSDDDDFINNDYEWEFPTLGDPFIDGFIIGALLGGSVGALVGSAVQSEVWEKANWQLAPLAYSDGNKGAALKLQIRF